MSADMPVSLGSDQVRHLRWRAQGLAGDASGGILEAVRRVIAVQAQEDRSSKLAVRPRSRGQTAASVEAARVEERTVVRTWLLRGTLHLVAIEDFDWLRRLAGPPAIRSAERRRQQLGLDEKAYSDALRRLRDLLSAHGPLSRAEIVEQLGRDGIDLTGQRAPHLLGRAALEGGVCHGPVRDGVETYVLVDDWLADIESGPSGDAALAEIARRYLAGYGPAGPRDLASWSGLSMRNARRGWELISAELAEFELAGERLWILASHLNWLDDLEGAPVGARLLPAYDPYLLGYRDRGLSVPLEHARAVHPGGGLLRPVVATDGLVEGTWRIASSRRGPQVEISLFEDTPGAGTASLDTEAADVMRFLGAVSGG